MTDSIFSRVVGRPGAAWSVLLGTALLAALTSGCDSGLEPPAEPAAGSIRGVIEYRGDWPPESELRDLRFVAMQFVPTDTADFLQLNRMAISDRLAQFVDRDTFVVDQVPATSYPFSGIAQKFGPELLDWRPVGLYEDEGGLIIVRPGAESEIRIVVDFDNPPPFPPEQ